MHVGFKSVELAGEISSCLCGQTEKDVTMEFPFMIQMLGTPCQVSNTKQGKIAFLLLKTNKQKITAFCLHIKELLCLILLLIFFKGESQLVTSVLLFRSLT